MSEGTPPKPRDRRPLALAVAALAIVAATVAAYFVLREPKDDMERLQGEWAIQLPREEGTEGGASGPPLLVRVKGDRWVYVAGGEERSFFRVKLNEAANPKEIDLTRTTPDGKPASSTNDRGQQEAVVMRGVYAIDKKTLKVSLAPGTQPRPTDLTAPHPAVQTLTKK
jgi:uncharacterized protein (TIGR03067 family)